MNIKTNKKFKLDLDSVKIDKAWKSAIRSDGDMIIKTEGFKLASDRFNKAMNKALKGAAQQIGTQMRAESMTRNIFSRGAQCKDITAEVNELNKTKEISHDVPCL